MLVGFVVGGAGEVGWLPGRRDLIDSSIAAMLLFSVPELHCVGVVSPLTTRRTSRLNRESIASLEPEAGGLEGEGDGPGGVCGVAIAGGGCKGAVGLLDAADVGSLGFGLASDVIFV